MPTHQDCINRLLPARINCRKDPHSPSLPGRYRPQAKFPGFRRKIFPGAVMLFVRSPHGNLPVCKCVAPHEECSASIASFCGTLPAEQIERIPRRVACQFQAHAPSLQHGVGAALQLRLTPCDEGGTDASTFFLKPAAFKLRIVILDELRHNFRRQCLVRSVPPQ
jgi:hypothetical protein